MPDAVFGITTSPGSYTPDTEPGYVIKIVDTSGTVIRTVVNGNAKRITWTLNGVGEATFTFPLYDPAGAPGQGADIAVLENEVQIYHNDDLLFWGVPLVPQTDSTQGDVEMRCLELPWYITRRVVDKPRDNLLTNPSFETALTGWTAAGVTAASVSSPVLRGTGAARLTQASVGVDTSLQQTVQVTGTQIGTLLVLVGWYYIESWSGPAYANRGLYVEGIQAGTVRINNDDQPGAKITDGTPRTSWQRAETTIWIPPNETWDINVRLYAPGGQIVWDALQLVMMESLGGNEIDIAVLAGKIVEYIQSGWSGKGTLNIGINTPATGITATKWYQFADHISADRALDEWVERDDGVDWSIEITPVTRTFRTWYPQKGTDRSATLTLQTGTNLASWRYAEDGTRVETDETILGEGDGPDREEGYARDISQTPIVLQGIYPASPGSTIDQLDPQATDRLTKGKRIVRLPEVVTVQKAGDLIHVLETGDTVQLVINEGWVQISDPFRIVSMTLDCRTDTLALQLNEV